MLIFPDILDRMVVLAAGLVMVLGLAYIVNRIRIRTAASRSARDGEGS